MQCSDTSSPSDKSYYAICICLSFTWCLNFSADAQKMQMCFLVDWRAIMQQLISPNRTTSASFSFHKKCSNVWRVEFGGLNSVLFFPFTCSVVNVYLWSKWLTGNEGEENWNLKIKLFFFFFPCVLNNKVEIQRELCGCIRSLRLLQISMRKD